VKYRQTHFKAVILGRNTIVKQLTREELTEYVENAMDKVRDVNMAKIRESINNTKKVESMDDIDRAMSNDVSIYIIKMMREYNQVLVETLYHVLYSE